VTDAHETGPDHWGTVDRCRLLKRLGAVPAPTLAKALAVLGEMFAL
jgi:hypothetical protein